MRISSSSCRWLVLVALSVLPAASLLAGPKPLQDATCELPPALRSVAGHALLRYEVEREGRVGAITDVYVSAEPTSQRDRFVAALKECVKGWRYEPERFGKNPIPSQLLIGFHYFRPIPEGSPTITLPDGRQVPRRYLEIMREEKLALAAERLAGPDFHQIHGVGWAILTDAPADRRDALEETVRKVFRDFDRLFPGAAPLPASSTLAVMLFSKDETFNEVAAFDNLSRMAGGLAGEYSAPEQMAYTSTGVTAFHFTLGTLAHVVTYHLVFQRLFADGREPPFWVLKGLGGFIQLMHDDKGSDPAAFDRGMQSEGKYSWQAEADLYLDAVGRWARSGQGPELSAFLRGPPWTDGVKTDLAYGLSWLLAHYLVSGEHGAERERFEKWLATAADEGQGDTILQALSLTADDLRAALLKYRKKLRSAAY